MRLSDIKTYEEMQICALCWINRCKRMVEVWNNLNESEERRFKAFEIWLFYKTYSNLFFALDHSIRQKALIKAKEITNRTDYKNGIVPLKRYIKENGKELIIDSHGDEMIMPEIYINRTIS